MRLVQRSWRLLSFRTLECGFCQRDDALMVREGRIGYGYLFQRLHKRGVGIVAAAEFVQQYRLRAGSLYARRSLSLLEEREAVIVRGAEVQPFRQVHCLSSSRRAEWQAC